MRACDGHGERERVNVDSLQESATFNRAKTGLTDGRSRGRIERRGSQGIGNAVVSDSANWKR